VLASVFEHFLGTLLAHFRLQNAEEQPAFTAVHLDGCTKDWSMSVAGQQQNGELVYE